MKSRSTEPTYHLYIWDERPSTLVRGVQTCKRGRRIESFYLYKDLVTCAQQRAMAAGYPKSRWSQLFDWNLGASR